MKVLIKSALIISSIIFLSVFVVYKSASLISRHDLQSPVQGVTRERISENIWYPKAAQLINQQFTDAPEVTAVAALFIETNTGEILYSKNPMQTLSIASLTKIMTTIVALENKSLNDIFRVSQRASEMEPDEMVLLPNETHSLRNLLDGIFLVSANDAAEVIAEGTTGNREEFINLMNSKASQLGMSNTIFVNPTGLEEDSVNCDGALLCQYSTALDVAVMSKYLISKWPEILDISSQPYVYIERTKEHQDYEMYSGINLLSTYPGVYGLKTGYTPEAGLTLVTIARQGNRQILGVLLGSVERRDDAKLLLDYSFNK